MNKKSKLLALSLLTSALCVGVTALLARGGSNLISLRAGSGESKTHTITFNTVSVDGEYDSSNYRYHLSFDGQVKDSDGTIQPLNSIDSETFLTCSSEAVVFNKKIDDITYPIYIDSSDGGEVFCVSFNIIQKASFDLDKSVVDYYVNGSYKNVKFENYGEVDEEGYNTVQASFDCYSDYGKEIKIEQVKLVFSCIQ